MPVEIEIENFQAVRKAKFLLDGFTVFVGRSDIGKSAIVRALQKALSGASGTDFVRHGVTCERRVKGNKKCQCQSTVRFSTAGLSIVWEKGDNINRYTIIRGGVESGYIDVGSGEKTFLSPEFSLVKLGDDRELVQVADQWSPHFLLDRPGSVAAELLSDVARLDGINRATVLVTKDRKATTTLRSLREKDLSHLLEKLKKYEAFDPSVVSTLLGTYKQLQSLGDRCTTIGAFLSEIERQAQSFMALKKMVSQELPEHDPLCKLSDQFFALAGFYNTLLAKGPVIRRLAPVEKITLPENTLGDTARGLSQLSGWSQDLFCLTELCSLIGKVETVPDPSIAPVLESLRQLNLLEACCVKHATLEDTCQHGQTLLSTSWPDETKLSKQAALLSTVSLLQTRAEALGASMGSLSRELSKTETEEQTVLSDFRGLGICPTCYQPFTSLGPCCQDEP